MCSMHDFDTLPCIQTFVAVVRAGSFTQAALRLGLTKSAVGKRVARLEQHVGVLLLLRNSRQIRLTPDGQTYFETCAAALDDIAQVEAALAPQQRSLHGRVRLDLPVAFGKRIVLPLLLEMANQHPELQLSLSFHDATVDLLRQDVDIVLRFGSMEDSSQLVARCLSRQTRMICASPTYLARHGTPRTVDELNTHRCIVGMPGGPPVNWVVREADTPRHLTPPATHAFNDGEAIIDAAVAGFGLCQMPSSLLRRHLARGELVAVLEPFTGTPVEVHVLWPRRATLSPRVRFVVDRLIEAGQRGELD